MHPKVQVAPALASRVPRSWGREIARRIRRAAHRLGVPVERLEELVVHVVDDAHMSRLHAEHMQDARPTDVMSFPAAALPGAQAQPLGDIVVDWDQVLRQAGAGGPLAELLSLCVHGLAHLMGHDHQTRTQARAMLRVERRAARAAGLGPLRRPYGGGA